MTTSRCLGVSVSASMRRVKWNIVLTDPLIIDIQCCYCVYCSYMERLCDFNSFTILIVCGRVLQFSFDWIFVDGHDCIAIFAVIKSRWWSNVEEPASPIRFSILVDLKSPSAIRRPWWCVELSLSWMVFLADPEAAAPNSITETINTIVSVVYNIFPYFSFEPFFYFNSKWLRPFLVKRVKRVPLIYKTLFLNGSTNFLIILMLLSFFFPI
jgi:hypothetical protein